MDHAITVSTPLDFDEAVAAVRAAPADQGFGILTEIDIQSTLRDKVGAELDPYVILGACNPELANRAIAADPSIGALLPCNVVVRATGDTTVIDALDPGMMSTLTDNADLEPVATEAKQLITAALETLPNS